MNDEKQLIDRLLAIHGEFSTALKSNLDATKAANRPPTPVEIFELLTQRAQFELEIATAAQDLVDHWNQNGAPSLLETDGGADGPHHKSRITSAVGAIGPRGDIASWLTQNVNDCANRAAAVKADPDLANDPAFIDTYTSERAAASRVLGDVVGSTQALHMWNQERGSEAMVSAFLEAGMNQPGASVSDSSHTHPDGTVARTVSVKFNPGVAVRKPRWRRRWFRKDRQ